MKCTATLCLLIVGLLLFGCVSTPTGNIEVFGTAAKGVADKVDTVIKEYNDANVQNEITKLAEHNQSITVASFDPIKKVLINEADKKNYAIYRANKALGDYADGLAGLARAGSREEIDLAAAKIYGSLHNMNEQYKEMKGSDLIDDMTSATIGRVIAEIGSLYVEKKRGEAIKSIVVRANTPVQDICDVIIEALLKGTIQKRLFTIRHTELTGYIDDYNGIVSNATFDNKRKALESIYLKYKSMMGSSAAVEQAIASLRSVKEAHATIKEEVEKDTFTSKAIVETIGKLKDVHSHYDDLEELMLTCKTQIVADENQGIICKTDKAQ